MDPRVEVTPTELNIKIVNAGKQLSCRILPEKAKIGVRK